MSEIEIIPNHDSAFPERRKGTRYAVSLPGRYAMPQRRGTRRRSPEYACRMVDISPRAMVLAGPVIGALGETVIGFFEELGKLEGAVIRTLCGGFAMTIEPTETQWAQLEAKLIWLEKNQRENLPDARCQKRIVPRDPRSTLILADGTAVACFVIDMSASGVAVSAEIKPRLGTPLGVGKVVGKVVRRFAEGFAVHFVEKQDPRTVERRVITPAAVPPYGQVGSDLGDRLPDFADRWLRSL